MRAAITKSSKPLAGLVARDANEGDTRLLVTDMLCEGSVSTSTLSLIAFLEVKRVATKLAAKHLRQVETYAVNERVE